VTLAKYFKNDRVNVDEMNRHVACVEGGCMQNVGRNTRKKGLLGRSTLRWGDNIKIYVGEKRRRLDWIHLAQDRISDGLS
jgi:hypothetical protein